MRETNARGADRVFIMDSSTAIGWQTGMYNWLYEEVIQYLLLSFSTILLRKYVIEKLEDIHVFNLKTTDLINHKIISFHFDLRIALYFNN